MKQVLVIEDSEVIREIIARIVRDVGFEPKQAASAAEGAEFCRQEKPAAVLLDWDLPSMGALDFLREVGAMEPESRPAIVLCATENDPQQFTLAKAAGAAHHILKPFDRVSMREKFIEVGLVEATPASDVEPSAAVAS
jgi:two-component system chemotaxis response regulator CheY